MSPRNEQYLSLCLTQANLSPLHYRHGCIIVRGGKVIGQGYNAYRPGFDGGALKTGVLPASALDGPAIAELKMRLKSKSKSKHKPDCNVPSDTFTPFETVGRQTAGPLSMHSEMMAIQSALSLSSAAQASQTSARGTKYLQKPASKTSRDSKRAKERTKGLKSYVEALCASSNASQYRTGKSHGNGSCFERATCGSGLPERGQCRVPSRVPEVRGERESEPRAGGVAIGECRVQPRGQEIEEVFARWLSQATAQQQ